MTNPKEIRWKQRYNEFVKVLSRLKKATAIETPDEIYRAGMIQFFEMTFELAWKTMKDFLEDTGYDIRSPRETIQQAYQDGIIEDGHIWIDALQKRNLMAHTYDENNAIEAEQLIKNQYLTCLIQLENFFNDRIK